MWKIKRYLCVYCLLLLLLLQPSACIASPQTYSVTTEQLTTLEQHLNELEENNEKLKSLLTMSEQDCKTALIALNASQSEIKKLRSELTQALIDNEKAKKSLQIANEELQTACESVKKSEAVRRRTEGQRNFWEVVAILAAGVAAAR